ncbi:Haloacid dehalogenase-like hydrolase domain-containing protein 3 [Aphanomyces cochlioides]|nr:Haloacid dehalogenase-like hydrolase domain-containing protein 3 [Aphanomyces cochlioides]
MSPIRHVTLDATGTLFRLKRPISSVYVDYFRAVMPAMASPIPDQAISIKAFGKAFKTRMVESPNFGRDGNHSTASRWWGRVITETFPPHMQVHLQRHPKHAEELMSALYSYYADGDAWEVFPEVHAALDALNGAGVTVGVISNFDERLHTVLRDLELDSHIKFVMTSWEFGAMKPQASIFHEAAKRLQCDPAAMLHIGDDRTNDYTGGKAAGSHALLLCRDAESTPDGVPSNDVIPTLAQVVERLQVKN